MEMKYGINEIIKKPGAAVGIYMVRSRKGSIEFGIFDCRNETTVGRCELRLDHTISNYYYGNIGYRVWEQYRGHGYAYQASLLLMELAASMDVDYLLITVSPENIPSVKTCEKLNGTLLDTVKVPVWHPLYRANERVKMIYRYDLKERLR